MTEEPRLSREIARSLFLLAKVVLGVGALIALIVGLIRLHPIYGTIAWYTLLLVGMAIGYGYQNVVVSGARDDQARLPIRGVSPSADRAHV